MARIPAMRSLLDDLGYAARQLARMPGFATVAVVTLALGIGANAALFAAVNALVFRPARAVQLDDVYFVGMKSRTWAFLAGIPVAHFRLLEASAPEGVEHAAADNRGVDGTVIAQIAGRAERVGVRGISGGYAEVLRVTPQAGRAISTGDDHAAAPVAVISDRLWREWFHGDRAVAERGTIRLDNVVFQIVGVAPSGFRGLPVFGGDNVDVWIPFSRLDLGEARDSGFAQVVSVRLRSGVPPAVAAQRIKAAIQAAALPSSLRSQPFDIVLSRIEGRSSTLRRAGISLLWLSALVLIAACANLANMLVARGLYRTGEVAIRRSLGASASRIFRLFLAEALVLALSASVLGLMLALGATRLFNDAFPVFYDRAARVALDLSPDYRVFLYAFCAGVASSLVVGALTAWRASRVRPLSALTARAAGIGDGHAGRYRLALVGLQVSTAVVLLMGAGLYWQQTWGTFEERLTFDTRPIATARFDLSRHGYTDSRARALLQRIVRDVRAIPGVQNAAISDGLPGGTAMGGEPVTFAAERVQQGAPVTRYLHGAHRQVNGTLASASPGFVGTLGLRFEKGRDLGERDQDGAPLVAVVSRNTAAELWGDAEPVGKRLMLGNDGRWRTVVGVFEDPATVKAFELGYPPSNLVVVPIDQRHQPPLTDFEHGYESRFLRELLIVLRSDHPRGHLDALHAAVRAIDPQVAVFDRATVDDSILSWAAPVRAARLVTASLALLATAISVAGVYGVVAFLVARRTREFGIRMALGASPRNVYRMVIQDARRLLLLGMLAGTLAAALGERLIDARVYRLLPNEVSMWAVVLLSFFAAGLAAAAIPARRAAALQPTDALREL